MKLQFDDAESQLHPLVFGGAVAAKYKGIGISRLSPKVVLRQPNRIPTQLLDHFGFMEAVVNEAKVVGRVEADREEEVAELHGPPNTGCDWRDHRRQGGRAQADAMGLLVSHQGIYRDVTGTGGERKGVYRF